MSALIDLVLASSHGRFSAPEPLGEGAAGLVYSVIDNKRHERVALKLLREPTARSVRALKNEFRCIAEIFHPNLVSLHELFASAGHWFFTMQCIEGQHIVPASLGLAENNDFSALREQLLQLAAAIAAVHAAGFVHRDVKPSNVLVSEQGRVTLLDFGLLRTVLNSHEGAEAMVGSPGYAAPEQFLGGAIGPAADWYGFGSVLYELLTGQPPFSYESTELISRKLRQDPVPPEQKRAGLPADLCDLCRRLLDRDPAQRPRDAEVLAIIASAERRRESVVPVSLPPRSHPPLGHFVGRAEMLDEAERLLEKRGGGPLLVLFDGPSGIGKTAAAGQLLWRRKNKGALILSSRCHPLESVPFNAWDGIVDELSLLIAEREPALSSLIVDELSQIFPVLAEEDERDSRPPPSGDPAERRRIAVQSLAKILSVLGQNHELILFFDDLHWADQDSLRILQDLLLDGSTLPFVAVGTSRRKDFLSSPLERSLREAPLREALHCLVVVPLDANDAKSLLDHLPYAASLAPVVIEQAAGDPYLLQELAREIMRGDADLEAAPTLQRLVNERCARLSPGEKTLVEVVALFGRPFPLPVATLVAQLEKPPTEALALLQAEGFIRIVWDDGAPQVAAFHDRVAEVVRGQLSTESKQRLFSLMMDALLAQGELDTEGIAICAAGAGHFERASDWARQVAQEAAKSLAFSRARTWFEHVLNWEKPSGAARGHLLVRVAEMAEAAGDGAGAVVAYEELLALPDSSHSAQERSHMQRRLVHSLLLIGEGEKSERLLRSMLLSVGYFLPESNFWLLPRLAKARISLKLHGLKWQPRAEAQRERLDVLDIAAVCYLHIEPLRAWLITSWQLKEALKGDDPRRLLQALSNELIFSAAEGQPALAWCDQVIGVAETLLSRVDDHKAQAWFEYARSLHSLLTGHYAASARHSEIAQERFVRHCQGVHWELENLRRSYVGAVGLTGDMVAPEADLRHWLAAAEERGDSEGAAAHLVGMAYAALCHDRPSEALAMTERARSLVINPAGDLTVNVDWSEAFVLSYMKPDPAALQASYRRMKTLRQRPQQYIQFFRVWSAGYAARLATILAWSGPASERARWIRVIRQERALLAREHTEVAQLLKSYTDAALAFLLEGPLEAAAILNKTAEQTEHGMRLFAASAAYTAAALISDAVQMERAIKQLSDLSVKNFAAMAQAHIALPLPVHHEPE